MRRIAYTSLAIAVAGYGGAAYGQQNLPSFEDADRNADGQISRDELSAIEGIQFSAADSNQDGSVDRQEYREAAEQQSGQGQTDVQVEQPAADVDVETPAPTVDVEQEPPEVTVEQQEPAVEITQPEANVNVNQQEPEVTVEQAEPEVEVTRAEPEVQVSQSEGEVNVVRPDSEQQQQQSQADRQPTRGATISESEAGQLVGQTVESQQGEEIGEVQEIVQSQSDNDYYAVVEIGGFLGIGAESRAIPFDELEFDTERNLVSLLSRDELEQMQDYEEQQYTPVDAQAAQAGGDDQGQAPAFEEVDMNSDGQISRAELAMVEGIDFSEADQNQDGFVSRDEYQEARQQ